MRYASGLSIPDPFVYVQLGSKEYVLVSTLEYSRAKREAKAGVKVVLWDDVKMDNVKKPVGRRRNLADLAAAFVLSFSETQVVIPENTWALHVETLQENGLRPRIERPFWPSRRVKTAEEIRQIKAVGRVAKLAYNHVVKILRDSSIEWNDTITHGKNRLTSEWVKQEIEGIFMQHRCSSGQTIVSCGEESAEPHNRGSGELKAGQPIIIDIFPRDDQTGYHFDMTRTLVKGTPSPKLKKMYAAVKKAQQDALDVLGPGGAKQVHQTVVRVFDRLGYATTNEEGFIHGTGHGVGLDIHEFPSINEKTEDRLEPGHVVTVEPGLYYKDIGGVRIEDTVVITRNGYTNLTNVPKTLAVK